MTQATLVFEAPKVKPETILGLVLNILSDGNWWTPYAIARKILQLTGRMISDAAVTARIRDLRKSQYGAHLIYKRIKKDSASYEYRLAA